MKCLCVLKFVITVLKLVIYGRFHWFTIAITSCYLIANHLLIPKIKFVSIDSLTSMMTMTSMKFFSIDSLTSMIINNKTFLILLSKINILC